VTTRGAPAAAADEAEYFRREAMGAFAHEIRTPLTSIRMVMELGRRQAVDGQLLLDPELAEMLAASVDDLQRLADDLQETSRLERSKASVSRGPCDLRGAVEAAAALLQPGIELQGDAPAVQGPWDAARLVRAIAGFAESANRMGDGTGSVRLGTSTRGRTVLLCVESGRVSAGERKPVQSDAGFGFFRSRQFVLAMGGSVHCERSERYANIVVSLPLDESDA
jgi:signal transduction histidine kinase